MSIKKDRLIKIYPETQEGHREASDRALFLKIVNPECGYYIEKNKGYRLIEAKEYRKFEL